ncbi:GAF domain-containing protein [Limnoraphis robusta]|uniref:GAF domain-containing protein n=1 Tax=Limnoraphis robusta CCNP1315 TaxID=3110306 RepID=A0ABU5U7W9_9CYAN|nr:GAF domain-containing protein [Limnoraphis robusta]MEA5522708.1 GAF domain-containing protein [Limnoraphis robusta CCNP1315]MEA5543834.1 GAF domain-containing protein [Limnoraphis robusta CCNP1324]
MARAIGAEIDDPCFAKRYVQPYQRGRVKATDNIYEAGLTDCHLRQLEPFAVKANLVAPIVVENQLKGLLVAHQCSGPRAWTELEIDLIRNVAIHAGYALDQASALEQQQATAQKAKILNNITYQLRNTQTLDRVFDLLVEQVRQVLKTDQVLIYKYHEDGFGSVVAESIVNNPPAPLLGQKIKDGTLSADDLKVIRRKRVYLIDNIHTCSLNTQIPNFQPYLELLVSPKAKTCLIAPLNTATTLHGLLVINHASSPRVWQDSELDFIKQLTAQVSLALDQLTLLQQQQVIAESERRLNQMSAILQESLKPDEIFRTVIGEARTFLNADRVTIYQFESQWQGRIVTESVAPEFPSALGNELYDPGSTHDIQAYLKGEVTAIADIKQVSLSSFHQRQLKSLQVKAKLVAPIIAKQKLHGLLIVHQCSKPRKWQTHEIDFIRKIAISVGQALNQVFLQQEQQASSQARQLNEICSNIRQTLNPQQICQTAVEELLELMQADRIVIDHSPVTRRGGFNPDVCLSQVTDINPPSPSEVSSPEKTQIIAEAVRSDYSKISDSQANMEYPGEILKKLSQGEEVIINDVMEASLTPEERQQFHQWEVQAALIIPVFVNQTLYAIATHHCSQTHQWQDSEIERFKQVGLQIGYALEQAQLLQQVQESRSLAEQMMNEQQQQKQQLEHQIETFLAQIEDCFQGDLTVRAQVSEGVMGTVADFFNATIESLQQLVTQVHHSAEIVTTTAAERQQDVEHLSRQAVQQTEIIIDALAQIQTLAHSIEAVATSAQAAQTQVQSVAGILHRGDQAMNRSVEGILSLEKTIRVTARKVKNLGESSQKISRIIKLINQFASQTHVLALNASVEASRMSHQEGGFAMVATEVRTLAEQSSHATAEIEEMIAEIQAETHEVVHAMKVGLKRVLRETELVQRTRKTLTEIVQASNQTHEFVNQIACSANHQAQTSTQLSETMEQVAAIASGSSQQSLQARQAFSQLIQVADQLQQGVEQFKVL